MDNWKLRKVWIEEGRNSGIYVYAAMAAAVIINCFLMPQYLPQQIFTMIFLGVLAYKFREGNKKAVYYSTLLFSLVNYYLVFPVSERINLYYFYITLMIYYIIIVSGVLKNWSRIRNIKIPLNKYTVFTGVFIAYTLISVLWAQDKIASVKELEIYFIMFLYAWMIYNENRSKDEILRTVKFAGFAFTGTIFMGLLKISGLNVEARNGYTDKNLYATGARFLYNIPCTFFYNPNNYAVFLAIGLIFTSIKGFFEKSSRKKLMFAGIYSAALVNLIFTMSRTSWISIFIMLFGLFILAFIIRQPSLAKHAAKYTVFTFLIFFVLAMVPGMKPYYGKLNATPVLDKIAKALHLTINTNVDVNFDNYISLGGEGSDNERATLLYNVYNGVIKEKHYLGFGTGNIERYVQTQSNTHQISNIHNMWFEVLGNFGVGIFIYFVFIYLSLMISMLLKLIKSRSEFIQLINITFLIIMGGYVFLAFGPSTVIAFIPHWFIFAAAFLIVNNYNKVEEKV